MTTDKFFIHFLRHVLEVKKTGLFRDLSMEIHLDENIAQLLAHMIPIRPINRFDEFADFIDQAPHQRFMRLFLIPGATIGSP